MATTPDEPQEPEPFRERVARAVKAPAKDRNRPAAMLAVAAALAALAPLPAGPIAAALLVIVAFDRGKR
jgi:uncharacterized iron-regulated membrane protein